MFLPRLRISSCWTFPEEMGWQKRGIQHIKKSKVTDPLQNSESSTWWADLPFGCQRSWLNPCSRSAPLHYMNPGSHLPRHSLRRAGPKGKRGRRTSHTGVADLWLEFGAGWTPLRRICHHLPPWSSPLLTVQFMEVIRNHTAQHIIHLWLKVSFGRVSVRSGSYFGTV